MSKRFGLTIDPKHLKLRKVHVSHRINNLWLGLQLISLSLPLSLSSLLLSSPSIPLSLTHSLTLFSLCLCVYVCLRMFVQSLLHIDQEWGSLDQDQSIVKQAEDANLSVEAFLEARVKSR